MKRLSLLFLLAALIGLTWSGCNKDEDNEPAAPSLTFDFAFEVNGEPLELGKTFMINGTAISFDVANYYVGGIRFKHANGAEVSFQNQYLLAGLNNSATVTGDLEMSDLTQVDFFIGVDPVTNAQTEADFTNREASDPLAIKDPSMHWNWNTGYKFVRVDGDADTDGDGVVDTGVAYHLGSDPFLKNFSFNRTMAIEGGENNLTFVLDLADFFHEVDLSTELDTHTGNNLPLAQRLYDNLDRAIDIR